MNFIKNILKTKQNKENLSKLKDIFLEDKQQVNHLHRKTKITIIIMKNKKIKKIIIKINNQIKNNKKITNHKNNN